MYTAQEISFSTNLIAAASSLDDDETAKVLRVLQAPESLRKRIVVRILQKRAAAYVVEHGFATNTDYIDWTKIPWQEIIVGMLKVLFMILPFIL